MKIRSIALAATVALGAGSIGTAAHAQSTSGYWSGSSGTWKSSTGLCWRSSYWSPAMATAECDPDLVPKPAPAVAPRVAPPPPPPPAPKPAAKPTPPKPAVMTIVMSEQFASNSATLTPAMRSKLDNEVVPKVNSLGRVDLVHVSGHTDRLGSQQYNQKLSERRADAVAKYLASKGVPASKIETIGMGKTLPIKSCPDQKDRKALIACLAPNRRVEVEIRGMPK